MTTQDAATSAGRASEDPSARPADAAPADLPKASTKQDAVISAGRAPEDPADLRGLIRCGLCLGRLFQDEMRGLDRSLQAHTLNRDLPRWHHRSQWYQQALVYDKFGLTDRGIDVDGDWGPYEVHGEERPPSRRLPPDAW